MYVAILFHLLGELTLMGTSTRGWFLLALLLLLLPCVIIHPLGLAGG